MTSIKPLLVVLQEFWTYWETYKVVVELLRQPKYILVCDRWDQMKYTSTAHFVKYVVFFRESLSLCRVTAAVSLTCWLRRHIKVSRKRTTATKIWLLTGNCTFLRVC